jgi:Protein of unknown function DUF262/Protein of unknown function (DUF1524)
MKSETLDVQQVFQDRRQYRVPFYQRAYVWTRDEQWEPLWNDVVEKAETRAAGEKPTPHFLGAIVLEPQARTGLRGVETYHIIDGQQRLTTLQYFLAAVVIVVREIGHDGLLPLLEGCAWNPNPETMQNADIERFKVWPTFRDRAAFKKAMVAKDCEALRESFPESFTQNQSLRKVGIEHPLALEAIWYYREKIEGWLDEIGDEADTRQSRLEQLAEALLRDLRLVSISLDESDDAQVIFETLNGRGAELHATDLIRNFIFMRADRENADSEVLYDTLWSPFEGPFWSEDQRRGRLRKPRLDWFIQSALQAELGDAVEIGKLYAEYRKFGLGKSKPIPAESQLQLLTKYADAYQQFTLGSGDAPIGEFGRQMANWDVAPTHALVLRVAVSGLSEADQKELFRMISSYLVRRAFCGLTTKNYNNLFLQLLRRFTGSGASLAAFQTTLAAQDSTASRWPTDDEFRHSWLNEPAHVRLGDVARVRFVLAELENGMRTARTEDLFRLGQAGLDVDHVLPDKWYTHWALNGDVVTAEEAGKAFFVSLSEGNPDGRAQAILVRERKKATIGNLTLVHYGVNRSLQNGPFDKKREAFFKESNLHLNRTLMVAGDWNEDAIDTRGRALFEIALKIWGGPKLS